MLEHVKMEIAFEIIAMRIAIEVEKNNLKEIAQLKKERELLYNGDKEILKKIYDKYSKEIKSKIAGNKVENESLQKAREKYVLSEIEFEEMYKKARELIIGDSKPAEGTPIAIVTGGQPGAGKIALVLNAKKELMNRGIVPVVIDGDTYRYLYKNSIEIATKYPELYSEITDKVTGKITNRLLKELINQGYNFIFEGVMGKMNIIDSLQEAPRKYDITAKLMATDRAESLLSIFERYILMSKSIGFGRLATIDAHDFRYNNFTQVAEELEERKIKVEVYERSKNANDIENPFLIYRTLEGTKKYKNIKEALIKGRENSLNLCKNNITQRLELINEELKELTRINSNIKKEVDKLNEILTR